MRRNWIIFGLIFLLVPAAAFFGCRKGVESASDLPGVYLADYKLAKEELTLNSDGSFEQSVTLKSTGAVDVAKGVWKLDAAKDYVWFETGFMNVLNGFQELDPNYTNNRPGAVLPVDRIFGRIQIGAAEGVLYTKAK